MKIYNLKGALLKLILSWGAFFICFLPVFGSFDYNQNCRSTYRLIFDLRFDEAYKNIENEKVVDPDNLVPIYLENYIDCLKLFISEEIPLYEKLKPLKTERIRKLENGDEKSPLYRFCLSQVHLQWAFARLKFSDYTVAANEIRKAYNLLENNKKEYPDFVLNDLGMGVVHVTVGLIPEKYHWVTNLLGFIGTVEQGINEIRKIADYHGTDELVELYKPEAVFFLSFITMNLRQNKTEVFEILEMLSHLNEIENEKSPLLIFASASIMMKTGKNDEALKLLEFHKNLPGTYPFQFLEYIEGVGKLNALDFSARKNFEYFMHSFKGQNYLVAVRQKLAWIAFLEGDSSAYQKTLATGEAVETLHVEEDKQALKEKEGDIYPNYHLLRARLLFDGGYYSRALDELLNHRVNVVVKTKKDFIEYSYRLGRIYHESGNYPKALEYYESTINNGRSTLYYFSMSAALQAGLIYESLKNWKKAVESFNLCLSLDSDEYKNSLHQKAKAGLERVKYGLKSKT